MREEGGYDRELRELGLQRMNDFTRRVEELTLAEATGDWGDEHEVDVNTDRPWREVE